MKFLSTITNNETTLENSYKITIIDIYFWNNDAN